LEDTGFGRSRPRNVLCTVQTSSRAQPVSYLAGTWICFPTVNYTADHSVPSFEKDRNDGATHPPPTLPYTLLAWQAHELHKRTNSTPITITSFKMKYNIILYFILKLLIRMGVEFESFKDN
jgi:hypothetical protein